MLGSSNSQLGKKWRGEGMNEELQTEMPAETMQISLVKQVVPRQRGARRVCFQLPSVLLDLPIFQERSEKSQRFSVVNQF